MAGKRYKAWVGFSDGKPFAWVDTNDGYGPILRYDVTPTKKELLGRYQDVRAATLTIETAKPKRRKKNV